MSFFKKKKEKIDNDFLRNSIQKVMEKYHSVIENDNVVLKDVNITIRPKLYEIKKNSSSYACFTGYDLILPDYGFQIHEMSAAIGSDEKTALGMSQASFVFGLLGAAIAMRENIEPKRLGSIFAGHTHYWNVYIGDIVSMGDRQDKTTEMYWSVLKEKIAARIGNQKICAIKIYTSNAGDGNVTCECRINDMVQNDLSGILEEIARSWDVKTFSSDKQYIILKQDEKTTLDYPLTEMEISELTEKVMKLYEDCNESGTFNQFDDKFHALVTDEDLALEITKFIPEICAERGFDSLKYPDTLSLMLNDTEVPIYKTQLFSYVPIFNGVMNAIDNQVFQNTNRVFEAFIYNSSLYNALDKADKEGVNINDLGVMNMLYDMGEGYTLR